MAEPAVLKRLLLVCIVAGLALSVYAALEASIPALQGSCTLNPFLSCQAVNQSVYSNIGPVPVWALGLGGFILLFGLGIVFFRTSEVRWLRALWIVAGVGLAASVVLAAVELFLINALCLICLGAYVADLLVFLVAWRLLRQVSVDAPHEASA